MKPKLKKRIIEEEKKVVVFHEEPIFENDISLYRDEYPTNLILSKRYILLQTKQIDNQIIRIPVLSVLVFNLKETISEGGEAIMLKKHPIPRSPVRPYTFAFEELVMIMKQAGCTVIDLRHGMFLFNNISTITHNRRCIWCKGDDIEADFIEPLNVHGKFSLYDAAQFKQLKLVAQLPARPFKKRMNKKEVKKRA